MTRRAFLFLAAALAAKFSPSADAGALMASPPGEAALTIDPMRRGAALPTDFLGLSYESALLNDPAFFTPENQGLLALIHRLGPGGVLRIGGNSSEFTRWQPNAKASRFGKQTVITPDAIQRLAAFVRASGWTLIYGLNLGTGTPEQAASEAIAVSQAVGDRLLAFQIGNEPDLFVSKHHRLRAASYSYSTYLSEWQTFARSIQAAVPSARFAGPDTAGSPAWVAQFGQDVPEAAFLSQHYYAEGPAGSPLVTINRLLHSSPRLAATLGAFQRAARDVGLPFRMTEMNSCYDGGQPGVSDTFASALWGVRALFQILDAGCAGVNFHGGPGGAYTPIVRTRDGAYSARPLYYAMLFFAQIGPGQLVSAQLTGVPHTVTAYAVRSDDGALTLALINTDPLRSYRPMIDPGTMFTTGTVLRLRAPSLDAKTGVTLGGAAVGSVASWQATDRETVAIQAQTFAFDLPASSAACVRLTA